MGLLWAIPLLLIGLVIGSFLNVVINRLATRETVVRGRSKCPHCEVELQAWQLLPVVSYIVLRAKCFKCKEPISAQYPLVELATGLLFVGVFWLFDAKLQLVAVLLELAAGLTAEWVAPAFFFVLTLVHIAGLVVLFVYDGKHQLLPDAVLLPLLLLAAATAWANPLLNGPWWHPYVAALVGGGFFLLLFVVSKGKWIGFGDVKLGAYMGLLVGWPGILVALFLAFVSGAFVGSTLLLFKKKSWGGRIAFGTFLTAATVATWFVGEPIADWYLGLIGLG